MKNIDWEAIEEVCATTKGLPDCVPQNIRQWDALIKQYERAVDLVNGTWEPHYNWNTSEECEQAVNDQFFLGKGFKHSIYECDQDLPFLRAMFKNVDWNIIKTAKRFTTWSVLLNHEYLTELPLLPRKVGGDFYCQSNILTSLKGCPEYVGGDFNCSNNKLTSLDGCPVYVGGDFNCRYNETERSKVLSQIYW